MAEDRTFSESELTAIVADRVARETADIAEERDRLAEEKTDLENKLDTEISARQAADQKAEKAEQDLADFKEQVETERQAASRKDDRLAKLRQAASHLDDSFFADEKRVARIVAMDEEQFAGYLDDMTVGAGKAPAGVPRSTAMTGEPAVGGTEQPTNAESFLFRDLIGAGKEG